MKKSIVIGFIAAVIIIVAGAIIVMDGTEKVTIKKIKAISLILVL